MERVRRMAFGFFVALSTGTGLLGGALLLAFGASPVWQGRLEFLFGKPDEESVWVTSFLLLGIALVAMVLAYPLSFDTRAARRPWKGMVLALCACGFFSGTVAAWGLFLDRMASLAGGAIILTATLLFPAVWLAKEALFRMLLERMLHHADAAEQRALALFLSRILLLFRPGHSETLRSVALERFNRGDRSEDVLRDLRRFGEQGDNSEEMLEALCRIAAENRDSEAYLHHLTQLHALHPDDADLTESLIAENLAQENPREALRLIEQADADDTPNKIERHATLLLDLDEPERAMDLAQRLAQQEGIPFKASGQLLRRVLEKNPRLFNAMNLLGEQACAARNLEQAIRRFQNSLDIQPNQPRIKRRLLELYRETSLTEPLEALLREMIESTGEAPRDSIVLEYADVLINNGKRDKARDFLAHQVEQYPDHFPLLDTYADALCLCEAWEEASAINHRASARAEVEEHKAKCRQRANRIEKALVSAEIYELQQEVERHPDQEEPAFELIRRLFDASQYERSLAYADGLLHRVPSARPKIKELLREKGLPPGGPYLCLSYLADLYLAEGDCEAIIGLIKPMCERSLNPDAIEMELCQKILRKMPNHLEALHRLGMLYHRERRFAEMVHHYVLFVAHGGTATPEINQALFNAYVELSDYPNARSYGEALIASSPEDDQLPLRLAQLAFKAKEYTDALRLAELAVQRNAKNNEALRLVTLVRRTYDEGRSRELQALVDKGEGKPEDYETLADLYHGLGRLDDTIPLYQKAARDAERTMRCKAKLALCLAEKGLFDLAYETLGDMHVSPDTEQTPVLLDLLYSVAWHFEGERMIDKAGRIYKTIFLVDAGYRDVVKKVEKFS
jgi:tetratricopeptide (TPR) repeat protein